MIELPTKTMSNIYKLTIERYSAYSECAFLSIEYHQLPKNVIEFLKIALSKNIPFLVPVKTGLKLKAYVREIINPSFRSTSDVVLKLTAPECNEKTYNELSSFAATASAVKPLNYDSTAYFTPFAPNCNGYRTRLPYEEFGRLEENPIAPTPLRYTGGDDDIVGKFRNWKNEHKEYLENFILVQLILFVIFSILKMLQLF